MTDYITSQTDFSNVTITNDYPCIVGGGTWTAQLQDSQTVYVDSNGNVFQGADGTPYSGPINIIGASLTIASGAVVDGAVIVGGSGNATPTVTIQSGGILQNSALFNGYTTIQDGGTSQYNDSVSQVVNISGQGHSIGDTFYDMRGTAGTSGTLNLSQLPSGTSTNFQTSDGANTFSVSAGGSILNPVFPDLSQSNPNTAYAPTDSKTITFSGGGQFGSLALANATHPDYAGGNYTLTNDNPTYVGGTWTASVQLDGRTGYTMTGDTTVYYGPLNLVNISGLTINPGAVADGITVTGGVPTIQNYGTLQNSFIANGYLNVYDGGVSQFNDLISEVTTVSSGGVTRNDYFYEPGSVSGKYNLSQMPSNGPTSFTLGDGLGNVVLDSGSTFDASYIGSSPNAGSLSIQQYYGATITNISDGDVCFLAGTLIETLDGYIPIEDIEIGNKVVTYTENGEKSQFVTWVGYKTVTVRSNMSSDLVNNPVRIVKNAIADNVPYKDLLVTPEHCLFLDNKFIPVRMLVNGISIFYDLTFSEYTYYHIETEKHSVINADGALTESYLDTGNRHHFDQDYNVVNTLNRRYVWQQDSAAPLVTNRDFVEPIFNRLLKRTQELGLDSRPEMLVKTRNSQLHLVTDLGEKIYPHAEEKGRFIFRLPASVINVNLVSLVAKPSQVIGPFVDDRRSLGVLVGKVTVLEMREQYEITSHLTRSHLKGWSVIENDTCRWTTGNAVLKVREKQSQQPAILVVEILSDMEYLLQDETVLKQMAG